MRNMAFLSDFTGRERVVSGDDFDFNTVIDKPIDGSGSFFTDMVFESEDRNRSNIAVYFSILDGTGSMAEHDDTITIGFLLTDVIQ